MTVGNSKRHLWELILTPLVVAIIMAIIADLYLEWRKNEVEKREKNILSYTVDTPLQLMNKTLINDTLIAHLRVYNDTSIAHLPINTFAPDSLLVYRIRLWNSGYNPLSNFTARFVFTPNRPHFQILSHSHRTNPPLDFGDIPEKQIDSLNKRFYYSLLNAGDEDTVSFLTSDSTSIFLNARGVGMTGKRVESDEPSTVSSILSGWLIGIVSILIILFLTILLVSPHMLVFWRLFYRRTRLLFRRKDYP